MSGMTNFRRGDDSRNFGGPAFGQNEDQSDMSYSANNFTVDEIQSEGIGPRQLGMGLQNSELESRDTELHNEDMSINGNPNVAGAWREMPRRNKPTLNLKKLTLAEKKIEISCVDKFLNILAAPYRHETGFYFRGKKTYTNQKCAICSILLVV